MGYVIDVLPAADIDRLEPLWRALRFYQREGASNYQRTLIMPVKQPPQPKQPDQGVDTGR
jgi:hypothetical protein